MNPLLYIFYIPCMTCYQSKLRFLVVLFCLIFVAQHILQSIRHLKAAAFIYMRVNYRLYLSISWLLKVICNTVFYCEGIRENVQHTFQICNCEIFLNLPFPFTMTYNFMLVNLIKAKKKKIKVDGFRETKCKNIQRVWTLL